MNVLTEIFETQWQVQQMTDDDAFQEAADRRNAPVDALTLREKLRLKLAAGILDRLVER